MTILENKIKKIQIFVNEFLKLKNKYAWIRKFNTTSKEQKNYNHTTFVQYKKTYINLFSLYCIEIREKSKNLRPNILGDGCTARPKDIGLRC
jgi:hypothetical protein